MASNPEIIETGLPPFDLEMPTDLGGIDLLARDADGAIVVVELKCAKANHAAVHQLSRYVQSVKKVWSRDVRGILAAPAVTAPSLNRLGAPWTRVQGDHGVAASECRPGRAADPLLTSSVSV